jgi:hypothetical protein
LLKEAQSGEFEPSPNLTENEMAGFSPMVNILTLAAYKRA